MCASTFATALCNTAADNGTNMGRTAAAKRCAAWGCRRHLPARRRSPRVPTPACPLIAGWCRDADTEVTRILSSQKNYYYVLKVKKDTPSAEIKANYFKLRCAGRGGVGGVRVRCSERGRTQPASTRTHHSIGSTAHHHRPGLHSPPTCRRVAQPLGAISTSAGTPLASTLSPPTPLPFRPTAPLPMQPPGAPRQVQECAGSRGGGGCESGIRHPHKRNQEGGIRRLRWVRGASRHWRRAWPATAACMPGPGAILWDHSPARCCSPCPSISTSCCCLPPPSHPPSLPPSPVCVCVCSERHQRGRPRGHELRRVGGIKCERCTVQCSAGLCCAATGACMHGACKFMASMCVCMGTAAQPACCV